MNQAVGISVLPSLSGTDRAKRIFSQIVFISSCCFFGCEAFLAPIPHVWPLRPGASGSVRTQPLPCGGRRQPWGRGAVTTRREDRAVPQTPAKGQGGSRVTGCREELTQNLNYRAP